MAQPTERERSADVRMRDQDVVEALFGTRRLGRSVGSVNGLTERQQRSRSLPRSHLLALQAGDRDQIGIVVHLLDGPTVVDGPDYRRLWNGVLKLFNLLQFLPRSWWTTHRDVERQLYPKFGVPLATRSAEAVADGPSSETLELASESLTDVSYPEVGFELMPDEDQALAEAELGWPRARATVLLEDQEHGRSAFVSAGWSVVAAAGSDVTGVLMGAFRE